ncbi:peptidoglycan recognition protein family protein [Streptomyces mayteni]
MRALLASLLGTACSAALLTAPALATGQPTDHAPALPPTGGLQSMPLAPIQDPEPAPPPAATTDDPNAADAQGLPATDTEPFSLLGVVWQDATAALDGEVLVRTRAADTGDWSDWRQLDAHPEHAPDPGSAEAAGAELRGGTAPLWVGPSDGVQVRVLPAAEPPDDGTAPDAPTDGTATDSTATDDGANGESVTHKLPAGLRLELIDPGTPTTGARPLPEARPLPAAPRPHGATLAAADHTAPRPSIVSRAGWGADESLREDEFLYTDTVKTLFVHHTAGGNDYACSDSPALIRGIYRYHVESQGWRDIGYNFLVDRCGTIYEGRAGGVAEPVQGAHTLGFNHNSSGVALLGSHSDTAPSSQARDALARLTAWKLGLHDGDPTGTSNRESTGGKWPAGTIVELDNVSGHRDAYATDCPGDQLYDQLPTLRTTAAEFQGR